MTSVTRRLTAVSFAVALGLSACGSDTTSTSPQTEAEDTAAPSTPAPSIAIDVVADPLQGHNLLVEVTNFTISPEHASGEVVDGEGHFHLYVDGERQMRFYNTALHLADLSPGEHTIDVELNNNDHSPYLADGEPIRASQTVTVEASEHEHHDNVEVVDLDPGSDVPTVELAITKDAKTGWNLMAAVTNFEFAPTAASTDRVDGLGHLHLYIDGVKITRMYGPAWHIPELNEGSHAIEVTLRHNDHSTYGIDGRPIQAAVQVDVSASEANEADTGHNDAGHNDAGDSDEEHGDDSHSTDGDSGSNPATSPDAADVKISVGYLDGVVSIDDDRVAVALGSTVALVIESDTEDAAHVHGYDHFVELTPGTASSFVFTADVPGLFEVELESGGVFLFEIEVS